MHTPTKAQWQTVIDNFKKVLPLAVLDYHLDMTETEVNMDADFRKTQCGTVHCVGGWYAVATLDPDNSEERISFSEGALRMANDLGIDSITQLENWTIQNSEIWGNENGIFMFSGVNAYNGAGTLAEVVTYLEGVRDRSPE